MQRERQTVEVILSALNNKDTPHCPHGPTLLFEQTSANNVKRYYGCSACRDKRKSCPFYQLEGEKVSKEKYDVRKTVNAAAQPKWTHVKYRARLKKFRTFPIGGRKFCETCSLLLLKEEWKEHTGHVVRQNVSDELLQKPSELLSSLEDSKVNAQYLFAQSSVDFVIETIKRFDVTHVLCIGSPRIHENLLTQHRGECESLLLDLDHRYGQFFDENHYCRYNMFNHHFFEERRRTYQNFLQGSAPGSLLVTMDPPFGGLIEVLAHTLQCVNNDLKRLTGQELDADMSTRVVLFFPYFNEHQISTHMPYLKMLDYKVNYDNHELFKDDSKMKQGSPIRIFTNLKPSLVILPLEEGYRFCEICERYVSLENSHCSKCNACTSKDGRSYVHCDKCGRCVKPARTHCDSCQQCCPKDHKCGDIKPGACFLCGGYGHKKRECPYKKQLQIQSKKRKFAASVNNLELKPKKGKVMNGKRKKKHLGGK